MGRLYRIDGDELRKRIHEDGYSMRELSKMIGKYFTTISNIVNRGSISLEDFNAISKYVDLTGLSKEITMQKKELKAIEKRRLKAMEEQEKRRQAEAETRRRKMQCGTCKYSYNNAHEVFCDYMSHTGRRRGCSPINCERYEPRRKK